MQKRMASLKNIYAAIHPKRNFPQEALAILSQKVCLISSKKGPTLACQP